MSLSCSDAFLYNIGLETLRTQRNGRNHKTLTRRIKGMLGWHLEQHRPYYADEIEQIIGLRHDIVHGADFDNLTSEKLLFSELYLKNSLLNIVRSIHLFPNKQQLITILDGYADSGTWSKDGSASFADVVLSVP